MKKISSQVTVALVCCILGFILTYQFKQVNKQEKTSQVTGNTADITSQIQQLTQEKKDKQAKIDELDDKIKKYEAAAANTTSGNEQLLADLQNSRIVNGIVDVKGPGVVITFTPMSKLFESNNISIITPEMLASFINNLYAYEAEAISVNDIRITSRTGILQSGQLLKIDNNYISPLKTITIKVIANQKKIEAFLDFPNQLNDFIKSYKFSEEKVDDLVIEKSEGSFKFKYAKPVVEKK